MKNSKKIEPIDIESAKHGILFKTKNGVHGIVINKLPKSKNIEKEEIEITPIENKKIYQETLKTTPVPKEEIIEEDIVDETINEDKKEYQTNLTPGEQQILKDNQENNEDNKAEDFSDPSRIKTTYGTIDY